MMNWRLLYKSAARALKWYALGWLSVTIISIVGIMAMVQNELNPWVFRPFVVLLYIATWIGFYKFGNEKRKNNE